MTAVEVLSPEQIPEVTDAVRKFIGHLGDDAGRVSIDVEYYGRPVLGVRVELSSVYYGHSESRIWKFDDSWPHRNWFCELLSMWGKVLCRHMGDIRRGDDIQEVLAMCEGR